MTRLRGMPESVRVLVVAGILVGVAIAGVGGRLAMLLLRLTSTEQVHGVESDDGFRIGEVTVAGTYNLLTFGAVVGIIGAAAYQWVRPCLFGPVWFQRLTLGAGAGVVVGSMVIHAEGVDFVVLTPTWLAITIFIALPVLFGVAIGPVVDRVEQPMSWTARGRRRWLLPVALLALFPLSLFVVAVASLAAAAWFAVRSTAAVERARSHFLTPWAMGAFWLVVVTASLVALLGDVSDVVEVTS